MEFWPLLPTGLIISFIAMSSGISGSNFWIPVYVLVLGVEPVLGFWLALVTMLFGFGSGITCNLQRKTINFRIAGKYLLVVLPGAAVGGVLSSKVPQGFLLLCFALLIFSYAVYTLNKIRVDCRCEVSEHEKIYWWIGAAAGFSKGLIATGLGKFILPKYLHHKDIKSSSEAVGTTVAIVFVANLVALLARLNPEFIFNLQANANQLLPIVAWVVPSVVIGGWIGPRFTGYISKQTLLVYISLLLIAVALVTLARVFNTPGLYPFSF